MDRFEEIANEIVDDLKRKAFDYCDVGDILLRAHQIAEDRELILKEALGERSVEKDVITAGLLSRIDHFKNELKHEMKGLENDIVSWQAKIEEWRENIQRIVVTLYKLKDIK